MKGWSVGVGLSNTDMVPGTKGLPVLSAFRITVVGGDDVPLMSPP